MEILVTLGSQLRHKSVTTSRGAPVVTKKGNVPIASVTCS
jgi:hypothetical protein